MSMKVIIDGKKYLKTVTFGKVLVSHSEIGKVSLKYKTTESGMIEDTTSIEVFESGLSHLRLAAVVKEHREYTWQAVQLLGEGTTQPRDHDRCADVRRCDEDNGIRTIDFSYTYDRYNKVLLEANLGRKTVKITTFEMME